MAAGSGPSVIKEGLLLSLDAANGKSYSGSGTVWTDLTNNGKNGTLQNGVTFSSSNKGSFLLDGVNDAINFGIGNTFFPLSQFTIDVWFKSFGTVDVTGTLPGIFGFTYGIRGLIYSSYIYYGVDNGTGISGFNTTGSIPFRNGNWYNATFYHNGSSLGVYINGVFNNSTSGAWSGTSRWPTNSWNLGRDNNNSNYFMWGELPIYRMYNRALTANEIKRNFNATRGRFGI
jgi:hypothetical protein